MNDKFKLVDIVMDALPANSPWEGNIKELVARLIAAGVTLRKHGRWEMKVPMETEMFALFVERIFAIYILK